MHTKPLVKLTEEEVRSALKANSSPGCCLGLAVGFQPQ